MRRIDTFKETLMLGKIEGGKRRGRQRDGWIASPTQWTWVWVNSRSWWWTGRPGMLQSMGSERVRHDWVTELTDKIFIVWQCCKCLCVCSVTQSCPWVSYVSCIGRRILHHCVTWEAYCKWLTRIKCFN